VFLPIKIVLKWFEELKRLVLANPG